MFSSIRVCLASKGLLSSTPTAISRASVATFSSQRILADKVKITFYGPDIDEETVEADVGSTVLEAAHDNDIELEGACEGTIACSTCHVIVPKETFDQLPEMEEEEEDMLDLAIGLEDTSRLGCQIVLTKELDGTRFKIPSESEDPRYQN